MLAGAINSLDQAGVDRLLQGVGSDTGAALRRILNADNAKQAPVPGKAKVKEEWDWRGVRQRRQICDSRASLGGTLF